MAHDVQYDEDEDSQRPNAARRRAIQAHLAGQRAQVDRLLGPDDGDGERHGLAKLLAFHYGVPAVAGEPGWRALPEAQREAWRADADMVRGYLVNAEGWTERL